MNCKPVLIVLFLLLCLIKAKAQTAVINGLDDKLKSYSIKMGAPALFVHFDKNVYTPVRLQTKVDFC